MRKNSFLRITKRKKTQMIQESLHAVAIHLNKIGDELQKFPQALHLTHQLQEMSESILSLSAESKIIEQSEELHRTILEHVSDAFFITDTEGDFTYICPNITEIFGYSPADIWQKRNIIFLLGYIPFNIDQLHTHKEINNIEHDIVNKAGTIKHLLINVKDVAIGKGSVLYSCRDVTERKRFETAVRQSEERYQLLSSSTFEAVFISQQGVCINQNETAQKLFGYSLKEAVGKSVLEWIHPDYRELVKIKIQQEYVDPYEVMAIRKDGSSFPAEIQARTTQYQNQNFRITALRDIDQRKKAEQDLKESERRFKDLFDNSLSGIFLVDIHGNILEANKRLVDMMGSPSVEATKAINVMTYQPLIDMGYAQNMKKCLETGEPVFGENSYTTKWGKQIYVRYYFNPIFKDNEINGLLANVDDVTELHQAKQALADSEEKFRQIAENIEEVFWLKDQGQILYISPAYEKVWGRSCQSLYDNPESFMDVVHEDDKQNVINGFEKLTQSGVFNETYRIRKPDGQVRWIWARTFPVSHPDTGTPQIKRWAGIAEDVTEIKNHQLKIQSTLEEKETLLRELYHRTKNNMQVISSLLELQSMQSANHEVQGVLRDTQSRIQSMALVHEKLYQSRNLSQINMREYLIDLVSLLRETFKAHSEKIHIDIKAKPLMFLIDTATPCGMIVNEAVANSFKYAFPGDKTGNIYVDLYQTERQSPGQSTNPGNEFVLEIADNGIGLAKDFDLDVDKKLGMETIFSLAQHQMQGSVEVTDLDGRGVRYIIRFRNDLYEKRV